MNINNCPFCNGKVRVLKEKDIIGGYKIMCVNEYTCRAEMRHVDTRKRAIKAWNTRVFDGKRFTRKQFGEALTRLSNEINIDWGNVGDATLLVLNKYFGKV